MPCRHAHLAEPARPPIAHVVPVTKYEKASMCRSPDWLPGRKKALEEEKEDSRAYFAILTKARELKVPAADG